MVRMSRISSEECSLWLGEDMLYMDMEDEKLSPVSARVEGKEKDSENFACIVFPFLRFELLKLYTNR